MDAMTQLEAAAAEAQARESERSSGGRLDYSNEGRGGNVNAGGSGSGRSDDEWLAAEGFGSEAKREVARSGKPAALRRVLQELVAIGPEPARGAQMQRGARTRWQHRASSAPRWPGAEAR
jgi:hypothetical protein